MSSAAPFELGTERLRLRVGAGGDAAAVASFQARNRQHFQPWDPRRPDGFFTETWWSDRLQLDRRNAEVGRAYRFFLEPREEPALVIGHVHFANVVRGAFQSCHLGFGLDEAWVGKGVMTEALKAGVRFAFETVGLHRIEANHRPENTRSAAVLKRLQFVPQGYARDYLRIDGQWCDHVLTALTNPAWQE